MSVTPPPPAKITRPRSRGAYPRTRLFAELNAARSAPCIWISGPPGAGKTTLAVSYLEHHQPTTLWYQIDEGDVDIASFFYYMSLAAQRASPRRKQSLPLFTPEYSGGLTIFTRRYFEQLYRRLQPPFAVILDNYQLIGPDAALHEVISIAIEVLPDDGNLIVASRELPPPAFARLQTNRDLHVLDWEQLRLDDDEVTGIIELFEEKPRSAAERERLQELAQGWVAGLILLLQSKLDELPLELAMDEQFSQQLFDYFAREVFAQQDEETRTVLVQTALLPRATARMAQSLTGNPRAGKLLSRLHRGNYFTAQHKNVQTSYQFHPMFRTFLLNQLASESTSDELHSLRDKAAKLLEQAGQQDSAIELYRVSQTWPQCCRLICEQAPILLQQGRHRTVNSWIESLPSDFVNQMPWLLLWQGLSGMFFDASDARTHLKAAYAGFNLANDPVGCMLAWSGVVDTCNFGGNWEDLTVEWLEIGERLQAEYPEFPSPEVEIRFIASLCFASQIRRPDVAVMQPLVDRVQGYIRQSKSPQFIAATGGQLIHYFSWLGHVEKIGLFLDELRETVPDDSNSPENIHLLWAEAAYHWQSGNADRGLDVIRRGREFVRTGGARIFEAPLLNIGTILAIRQGDLDLAQAYIDKLRNEAQENTVQWAFSHLLLAELAWSQHQWAEARHHLERTEQILGSSVHLLGEALINLCWACLHFSTDDPDPAHVHLARARDIGNRMESAYIEYHGLQIAASHALELHQDQECVQMLERMFSLGREHQLFATIWADPAATSRLCGLALEQGVETEHVVEVIRRNRLLPDDTSTHSRIWPWPVKIHALGGFRLECNHQPVDSSKRNQKKVIELLKALVTFGPGEINATLLADVLWPDNEADTAYGNLKSTVHRLRKLLGAHDAIDMSAGHVSLNRKLCWSDASEFERLIESAGNGAEHHEKLEQAIEFYSGPLLGSDEEPIWILEPRDRLRKKYLRALTSVGEHRESRQEWYKAIEIYERGLDVDELTESLYRKQMHCYLQLGENAEALIVYDRCRAILDARLGIAPSRQTQVIAEQVRQN